MATTSDGNLKGLTKILNYGMVMSYWTKEKCHAIAS
jgi:hypothetical protein